MQQATLIGAGNAAWHLGLALHAAGVEVLQVYSRNLQKAKSLSDLISSEAISDFAELRPADLVIVAVSDQAIPEVAAALPRFIPADAFVVHTSGGTSSAYLAAHFERYGVFYPLQTFTAGREVDFRSVPLCVHAGREEDLLLLEELGRRLCDRVYRIDDERRQWLHLAAVAVNNFPNHLYALAEQTLNDHQLPFDLLRPLILETARKVQDALPGPMQTGPAARGDRATIEAHLRLLEEYPQFKAVYEVLTRSLLDS